MNVTLMTAFWRQRLTSPIRMLVLLLVWGQSIGLPFLHKPIVPFPAFRVTLFGVIMGAGIIGSDISTGVVQLILARPIARREYVVSRWLALGLLTFLVGFLGWLIVLPFSIQSGGPALLDHLWLLSDYLFSAFGVAAVVTAFSALFPGFGDVALLLTGCAVTGVAMTYGVERHHTWLFHLASEIQSTLLPSVSIKEIAAGGTIRLYPLAAYTFSVTLAVLIGVSALSRKELSYASAS